MIELTSDDGQWRSFLSCTHGCFCTHSGALTRAEAQSAFDEGEISIDGIAYRVTGVAGLAGDPEFQVLMPEEAKARREIRRLLDGRGWHTDLVPGGTGIYDDRECLFVLDHAFDEVAEPSRALVLLARETGKQDKMTAASQAAEVAAVAQVLAETRNRGLSDVERAKAVLAALGSDMKGEG